MFEQLRIGESAKQAQKFVPNHPNPDIGTKHGIALYLHGKHSEVYRNAIADILRRSKGKERTTEEAIADSVELIVQCCTDFEGAADEKGKPVKFDRDKLRETLLQDDYRWMRVQADNFMQQDEHFFPKPSKS